MKGITLLIACLILLATAIYSIARQSGGTFVPVTDAMLENPDPADWLMWRRTLNSWGYSPLDQINATNVSNLRMVWTRGMGPGIQEATPLVYRGVMYLPNPSDLIQAINAATGDLIWEYKRQWSEDVSKILPIAPSINRNIAIYGNNIIDTSADDQVYALDARSGKLAWETRILDMKESPAQETSGPIIAKGKIFSGRGCEPRKSALACVIVAHDAKTGKELWRTRTIPMPGESGDETWGGLPYERRSHVGTWMVPSYDPELNLLYVGTSVTSPAPKFMLSGNEFTYLYHNSTLALNADTGKIVWYYQHLVDHWDFDHPFERLLVDTVVAPSAADVSWINSISVETGKTVWRYEQRAGYMSLVGTGGGLIFGGDTNGHFRAFDQNSGAVLWEINLGSPVTGYPITYAVGGKQYVAVSTGNSLVSTGLNRLAPELHPSTASNIFVFALP